MYTLLLSPFILGALSAPLQPRQDALWTPSVGTKWQIVISQPVDTTTTLVPSDADVYDVDLFYTSQEDVAAMKAQGKKVICYYSAGSAENWRPDYNEFQAADIGSALEGWAGENWLNVRSDAVLEVMKERIKLASDKGCDAIDPDNMDGYSNGGGGFDLTQDDAIKYLQGMAEAAASYGMSTGLKNAQEILPQVLDTVQFAVNEECVAQEDTGCTEYNDLLAQGKAVFHIEYVDEGSNGSDGNAGEKADKQGVDQAQLEKYCVQDGIGSQLSTVVKYLALDGWVQYCDGEIETTAINENYQTGDPKGGDKKVE